MIRENYEMVNSSINEKNLGFFVFIGMSIGCILSNEIEAADSIAKNLAEAKEKCPDRETVEEKLRSLPISWAPGSQEAQFNYKDNKWVISRIRRQNAIEPSGDKAFGDLIIDDKKVTFYVDQPQYVDNICHYRISHEYDSKYNYASYGTTWIEITLPSILSTEPTPVQSPAAAKSPVETAAVPPFNNGNPNCPYEIVLENHLKQRKKFVRGNFSDGKCTYDAARGTDFNFFTGTLYIQKVN